MMRSHLRAELAKAERHVREGERHLLRQREIVDELERHGRGNSETAKKWEGTSWRHLKCRNPSTLVIERVYCWGWREEYRSRNARAPLPATLDRRSHAERS